LATLWILGWMINIGVWRPFTVLFNWWYASWPDDPQLGEGRTEAFFRTSGFSVHLLHPGGEDLLMSQLPRRKRTSTYAVRVGGLQLTCSWEDYNCWPPSSIGYIPSLPGGRAAFEDMEWQCYSCGERHSRRKEPIPGPGLRGHRGQQKILHILSYKSCAPVSLQSTTSSNKGPTSRKLRHFSRLYNCYVAVTFGF